MSILKNQILKKVYFSRTFSGLFRTLILVLGLLLIAIFFFTDSWSFYRVIQNYLLIILKFEGFFVTYEAILESF